jgi:hypothetical protein
MRITVVPTSTHPHTPTHTHTYTRARTHIHTHTHTHTHTRTHIQIELARGHLGVTAFFEPMDSSLAALAASGSTTFRGLLDMEPSERSTEAIASAASRLQVCLLKFANSNSVPLCCILFHSDSRARFSCRVHCPHHYLKTATRFAVFGCVYVCVCVCVLSH